jgi:hypothetical protein
MRGMKTIVNKSGMPLRVPLPGGKILHLGPGKSGQIADGAAEHAALRKLIDAGTIELQGDGGGDNPGGEGGGGGSGAHPESTAGRGKAKVPRRGGQRGA